MRSSRGVVEPCRGVNSRRLQQQDFPTNTGFFHFVTLLYIHELQWSVNASFLHMLSLSVCHSQKKEAYFLRKPEGNAVKHLRLTNWEGRTIPLNGCINDIRTTDMRFSKGRAVVSLPESQRCTLLYTAGCCSVIVAT